MPQGRYKAILVQADEYAKELSRYIHLNPVRAGITAKPEEYHWSSYKSYIGKAKKPEWHTTGFIYGYFDRDKTEARKKYRRFTNDLIGKNYENPLEGAVASTILGREEFVKEITEIHIGRRNKDRNLPALRELSRRPSIEEMINKVKSAIGKDDEQATSASIYFCHRYSGARLREIGTRFGIGESAVSQASRRFAIKMAKDGRLKKTIERIEGAINVSKV